MEKLKVKKKNLRANGIGGAIFDYKYYLNPATISELEAMAIIVAFDIKQSLSYVLEWDTEDIKIHYSMIVRKNKENNLGGQVSDSNSRTHD